MLRWRKLETGGSGSLKVIESCTIRSADCKNPTLEPNITSIGKPVAKLWYFCILSGDLDVCMILVDHRSSELWKNVKLHCFLLSRRSSWRFHLILSSQLNFGTICVTWPTWQTAWLLYARPAHQWAVGWTRWLEQARESSMCSEWLDLVYMSRKSYDWTSLFEFYVISLYSVNNHVNSNIVSRLYRWSLTLGHHYSSRLISINTSRDNFWHRGMGFIQTDPGFI